MTQLLPSPGPARCYFDHWREGRFEMAIAYLAEDVSIETPVNHYPTKADFAAALKAFGGMVDRTELLADHEAGESAVLVYDMDVRGLGRLRIAEHFELKSGKIVVLRQIHDTMSLRNAGFVSSSI